MKDFLQRAVSLGLGIVVESKEQIEKLVDDLVKKGEVSKSESTALIEQMVQKGDQVKEQISAIVQEKMQTNSSEQWVTKEEFQRLEARIAQLEQQLTENK
ncbi:phasin family protein [Paenibacillus yanchengensis]|uniref:Phasin family protein n=1 Tax=Paenibacillus yanchengensis TaxID=2035833 RepID=A0ABW4YJH4_9BACL